MNSEYRVVSIENGNVKSEKKTPLSRGDRLRSVQRSNQGCVYGALVWQLVRSKQGAPTKHTPRLVNQASPVSLHFSPLKRGFFKPLLLILFLAITMISVTQTVYAQTVAHIDQSEDLQTLESYLEMAVERNPELASLKQVADAQRQRVPQVQALPDPEVNIGFYINPVMETNLSGRFSASAMQMFPWFGTLQTRGQVEETISDVLFHQANARQLEILKTIQELWFKYYQMEHHVHINMEIVQLVQDMEDLAESRYETGMASQADLLRIQMEEQRLMNRIEELRDEKNPIREELNALLNRNPDEGIVVPSKLPARNLSRTKEELFRLAQNRHPDFNRIDSQRNRYDKELELARLEGRPSFGVGLEYMARDFGMMSMMELDHVFIGKATVRIPLYRSKYRAQKNEAQLQLRATDNLESDLRNRLQSDLERTMKSLRDAQRDFRLIVEELLPRSRQTVEILSEEYAGGKAQFDDLLQVLRELLMLEMERVNSLVAQNRAMAAIEQITAQDLRNYE